MGNSWFQFQQFRIEQDRCAMKVSTDSVLLGTLVREKSPKKILDVGTGTGVVALILAQRFPKAQVQAVELDEEAANQAAENFANSPFSNRLKLVEGRFQEFPEKEQVDLLVSNPPYFPNHLKARDPRRNQALHTDELSFWELLEKAGKLLSEEGSLWVILPPAQMKEFEVLAARQSLFPKKLVSVKDSAGSRVIRQVLQFQRKIELKVQEELILKEGDGSFSRSYSRLISGFLLGF
ncbi:tRNA1(Val) (adenine(37)-N6)-methyltransferase [Algoriphagus confluentis]|uniref:tRNA1(Val) (adenine(37)-N6)-methyltransferase n=1 Tax=Algoriphagus confluentis TaxID=1697556 RepID=A0ABQ6PLK2_9BACT|nr:methyltransferase [Algoriphagus confluentis]